MSVRFPFTRGAVATTLHFRNERRTDAAADKIEKVVGAMKEYRLTAWPELAPPFHRTAFRRMATDMSHRFVTMSQLAALSGMRRQEVRHFVEMLDGRGLVVERECVQPETQFWSLRPLGGWLRRAMSSHPSR